MATVCHNCNKPVGAGDVFCGNCGQPTAPSLAPIPQKVLSESECSLIEASVSGPLDPLFNKRYRGQLIRRGVLYAAVVGSIDVIGLLLNILVSLVEGSVSLLAIAPVLLTLSLLVVVVVFWVLPVPALLGEWHRLVTFRAPQAAPTLEYIQHALDRHHAPYDSLAAQPITPPGEGRKTYLELRRGFFVGYVSSFAHGDDLYVGWTFWIYVTPLRALLMRLGRKVQDYTGRGNDIYQTLRFESAQATVNVLHACTLEGIDFAMAGSSQAAAPAPARSQARARA
jgi:hypothetical protein